MPVSKNSESDSSRAAVAKRPLVYIVIVNYNSSADVRTCLLSLERQDYSNAHTLVIDNFSPADDIEGLSSFVRGRGSFVRMPENGGFAAGNNLGLHIAKIAGAKYVWLLNPDTVVEPRALSELVAFAEASTDAVVCGSKVLYGPLDHAAALELSGRYDPGKPGRIWSSGGSIDFENQSVSMIGWNEQDSSNFSEAAECDYLPGCSMLLSFDVVEKAGAMPEEFFMYFEETEWCVRMKRAGIRLAVIPKSIIWHRFEDSKLQSANTVYYYNRNSMIFWHRHGSSAQKRRLVYSTLFKRLPSIEYAILRAPTEESKHIFKAHRSACLAFLFGKFGRR